MQIAGTDMKYVFLRILIVLLFLGSAGVFAVKITAQAETGWSVPMDISDGIASTPPQGFGPVIAADQEGRIHAVWAECSLEEFDCKSDTLYYSVLIEDRWSSPVDILAVPQGEGLVSQALLVDPYGRLVLVWMGARGINVSVAESVAAGSARSWSTTTIAPQDAIRTSDLFITADGIFHLMYIANDRVLEYSISDDAGVTWTEPVIVYSEERSDAAITVPKIAMDSNNSLYTCWTMTSESASWGAVGVQFASSSDGGMTWTSAQKLAEGLGYGYCAVLSDHEERLHAFWLGSTGIGGRYHRWSSNGGASWTETEAVAAPGQITGFPGAPRLLEDGLGVIHVVFPGYGANGEQIWHARWENGRWTVPLAISGDLPHSEKSAATLDGGKYLHVAWLEYQSLDIWHRSADLGAPLNRIPVLSEDTPLVSSGNADALGEVSPETSTQVTNEPTPISISSAAPPTTSATILPLLIPVLASAILIVGAVVYRLRRR